jgi:hypothetical protein
LKNIAMTMPLKRQMAGIRNPRAGMPISLPFCRG